MVKMTLKDRHSHVVVFFQRRFSVKAAFVASRHYLFSTLNVFYVFIVTVPVIFVNNLTQC